MEAKPISKTLKVKEERVVDNDDSMTLAQFSQTKRSSKAPPTAIAYHQKSPLSSKRKRNVTDEDRAKLSAIRRAEEVQAKLDPKFPSFVKSMVPSHVATGFWMGLPAQFCSMYLPKQDAVIFLIDEDGNEYTTKFLPEKTGLSGGWKGFSSAHKLVVGDALVFQLIKTTKFKVYILRAYDLAEVDGALGLLGLDSHGKQSDPSKGTKATDRSTKKRPKSFPLTVLKGSIRRPRTPITGPKFALPDEQTGNDSEEVDSEVVEGNRSIVEIKEKKVADEFTIVVNGSVIDPELSDSVRGKYCELCVSQKAILHEHLLVGSNCKLVAGIISETVNIADAIRASKLSTFPDQFKIWEKSLRAFEELGMNVGFLQSRLRQLVGIAFESEEAREAKKYKQAVHGQAVAEEEIKTLEMKLVELKEGSKVLDEKIETLKVKAQQHEMMFIAGVSAPW
ncbi:hypothetical protein Sjap_022397 [Stephania japonica]|uniref:TF-B3 domain-containing protein n=1 Tax=Stephania japonica TaxID=461633 RepID=A0AAP0HUZ5_9MAGN